MTTLAAGAGGTALAFLAASLASCDAPEPVGGEKRMANEAVQAAPSDVEEPVAPKASNAAAAAAAPSAPPSAAAPPKGPAPASWSPGGYRLVGTEPFWGGTVTSARILYQTPENQAGEPVAVDAAYGATREIYSGTLGSKPFVLTLTKGPCSDGMSDKVHAFTAALQVRGETRQGCADPRS
jgi:uncharacterized membrane protein